MKRIISVSFVLVLAVLIGIAYAGPKHGATEFGGNITVSGGSTIDGVYSASAYASFATAVSTIGASNATLRITTVETVSADVTVPTTMELMFTRNGSLSIDTGKTVTINGPQNAGMHQIYSGSGSVSFGSGYIKEVYPQWWGATGDGSTDDATAIQTAGAVAFASGKPMRLAGSTGGYLIKTPVTWTLTNDLEIIADSNASIIFSDTSLITVTSTVTATPTLSADMARDAVALTVTSTTGIEVGDILAINTTEIAETGWNYVKREAHVISAVATSLITLDTPLNFSYTTTTSGLALTVYEPHSFRMFGGSVTTYKLGDGFAVTGTKGSIFRDIDFYENGRGKLSDPISLAYSVDSLVENISFDGVRYGVNLNSGSHNFVARNITSRFSHHPITPNTWADTVLVSGLTGYKNDATMDAHPSFDVIYEDVVAVEDSDLGNLRSVGGIVRDSRFHSTSTSNFALFQTVALSTPAIYDDYNFTMSNVVWEQPNATSTGGGLSIGDGGVARFHNVTVPALSLGTVTSFTEIYVSNSKMGFIRARATVLLSIINSLFDGSLAPGGSSVKLLDIPNNADLFVANTTFKNATNVVQTDANVTAPRLFVNSKFADITTNFQRNPSYSNYEYTFTGVDFDTVAAFSGTVFGSKTKVSNSRFTGGAVLSDGLTGSATWDAAGIAISAMEAKDITVTGSVLGDYAICSFSLDIIDLSLTCDVTAADTVTAVLMNATAATVDLGSGTIRARVFQQ